MSEEQSIRDSLRLLDIIISNLRKDQNYSVINLQIVYDNINENMIKIASTMRSKDSEVSPSTLRLVDKYLGKRIVRDAENPDKTFVVNVYDE